MQDEKSNVRPDFITIDFETATNQMSSACSIGIVAVKDAIIVDKFYSLIRPPKNFFDDQNIAIHGITPEQTENAPTFAELWPEISRFFNEHVPVVAHNPQFDMSVLRLSTSEEIPDFVFVNSMDIARFFVEGSLSLENCAKEMNINLGGVNQHNAGDDAWVCAYITTLGMKSLGCETLWELIAKRFISAKFFSELKPISRLGGRKERKLSNFRVSDVTRCVEEANENSPLLGKNVVFTGQLSMEREEAAQLAVNAGAVVKTSVSKKTDFLVVGKQDVAYVGESGMSSKERKACELNETGAANIQIINEEAFYGLLNASAGEPIG